MRRFASPLLSVATPLALVTALAGCTPTEFGRGRSSGDRDDVDAPFGTGKADGQFTDCQLGEVVLFASESTTDVDTLVGLHIHPDAAAAIVAHRLGPDGLPGTADDNIYDDLVELDEVDFVGPIALDFMVAAIVDRCEVDLDTRPFIDATTFDGPSGGGSSRNASELEAAMTIGGITGQALHDILARTDDRDRTIFSRLRRSKAMEGLTYSYPVDEVPWTRTAQEAREATPFLQLTIEGGRFDPDLDGDGERELSLGTDIMDDTYFDTLDYQLLRNEAVLRGRVRWDGVDVVRRLLVAAKFDSAVDQAGIKRAAKVDVRTEGGTHRLTLDEDVMAGKTRWSGSTRSLVPVRDVYDKLVEAQTLPNIGSRDNVLLLDPKVHVRSTRSRFHFNLATLSQVRNYYNAGITRLEDSAALARTAIDEGIVEAADVDDVEAYITSVEAFVDKSAIAARVAADLVALDPDLTVDADLIVAPNLLPNTISDATDLERHRIVSVAYDEMLHELSDELDDLDREITGTSGLDFDDHVDTFVLWRKSMSSTMRRKTIYAPFLDAWTDINEMADADREAELAAYNDFGAAELAAENDDFEDFEPITAEGFAALGRHLQFEVLKVSQRQIATAGVVSNGLWFDRAREHYIPNSARVSGNFLIDTIDQTEMVTRTEWNSIPEAERGIDTPLPPEKIFHTGLVNEVQIELGKEDPYLDRIADLEALVADGTATEEDQRVLTGAHFVFDHMQAILATIAELKGDAILDRLDDEGAPNSSEWVPATASKGTTALTILRNRL